MIQFYGGSDIVQEVSVADFTDVTSERFNSAIAWGDNSANSLGEMLASADDLMPIMRVVIDFGESGGLDNVVFTTVPAPGTIVLLAGAGLARRRRRRG